MAVLRGRSLNGKLWLLGTAAVVAPPPPPPAPAGAETLSVNALTAVAGSAYTISGTYTNGPPTALDYSTDGAQAVWNPATAGLSIGSGAYSFTAAALSAGNYTVSVRDHNSQAIIGTHALTVTTPISGVASSYFLTPATSGSAPGAALSMSAVPVDGTWPAGTISLTATGAAGTLSTATLSPTAGGSASVPVTFTGSAAGVATIKAVHSAGMIDAPKVFLGNFAASNGTASALAASIPYDRQIWQRDTFAGTPAGFSTGWGKGWGQVPVTVNPTAGSAALWAKLYDADSAGATTAVGTGTLLQGAVQVYGPVVAGSQTVSLNLPAGPDFYFMELSTDAAFTNPVRLAKTFGVGNLVAILTRSQGSGLADSYNVYGADMAADLTQAVNYTKASTYTVSDFRYANAGDWHLHTGKDGSSSTGAMEICRLMASQTGCLGGVIGEGAHGGDLNDLFQATGKPSNTFLNTVSAMQSKYRYFVLLDTGGDYSTAQWKRNAAAMVGVVRANAAFPVVMCLSAATGWFGSDGSNPTGYTRINMGFRDAVDALPLVSVQDQADWNHFVNGHSTMPSRTRYARSYWRMLMSSEVAAAGGFGNRNRGPTMASSATRAGNVITLPFTHHGGTSIIPYGFNETNNLTWTESTPTAAALTMLFALRPAGQISGSIGDKPIRLSGVTVDNTNNVLLLTIDSTSAGNVTYKDGTTAPLTDASAFTLQYNSDFAVHSSPYNVPAVALLDNNTDPANGIAYGWGIRSQIDILVAAPAPAAQSLAINTPLTTVAGGWLKVSGPAGTGAPVASLQVSINGGAAQTPATLNIRHDNSWDGLVQAPAAGASNTVAVFRPGQGTADATSGVFQTVTRAGLYAAPPSGTNGLFASLSSGAAASGVASYSVLNKSTLWQDVAGTVPVTASMQTVAAMSDELGNAGNILKASAATQDAAPFVDSSTAHGFGLQFEGNEALTSSGSAPMLAQLAGDMTMLCVHSLGFNTGGAGWTFGTYNAFAYGQGGTVTFKWGAASVTDTTNAMSFLGNRRRYLVRFRASDGLLEIFDTNGTALSATAAGTPAPGALTLNPNWGAFFSLHVFNTRFSDADKTAALTWLTNTYGAI